MLLLPQTRSVPFTFCFGWYAGRPERSNFFVYASFAPRAPIIFARASCMPRPSLDAPFSSALFWGSAGSAAHASSARPTFAIRVRSSMEILSSLEFLQLLAHGLGREREILAVLLHQLLALAREH